MNRIVSLPGRFAGAFVCLALLSSAAMSQSNPAYPTQAIRLVVGFAAGGGNDIVARVIADKLAQRLGQPVIVDNKPGAGGVTSAAFVAGQAADGHTLLLGAAGAMAIAPLVTAAMPFDTLRDFSPISLVAGFPLVMIVSGKSEFKTVQDLVAWSKANQEKANYATSSPTFTLSTELFKIRTGAHLQNVPYRSSGESVTSVLGEQTTTAIVDMLPAMPLIEAGQIRALAVTAGARVSELPNVPTMQEAGVPDMNIRVWTGIFVRKGTPPEIVTKLESEIRAIMATPDVTAKLRSLATDSVGSTSEELRTTIQTDMERWSGVAKAANIKPQ